MPTLRRPRSITEYGDDGPGDARPASRRRVARSRRSTSAPRSASSMPANCTGPMFGSSMTRIPASGPATLTSSSFKHARRVLVEELRPDVIAERHVGQLGEDAVEVEAHREVARVDDLVGAARVREVDDVRGCSASARTRGRVVEVRPLQQQLHHQLGPRLAAVARDDLQLGEEPAHLVEQRRRPAARSGCAARARRRTTKIGMSSSTHFA